MNDDANLWSEQALNPETLADLERTLAAPLDSHLREQLRKAVDHFQFLAMADGFPELNPGRAQRRKELNALAKAAIALANAVSTRTITLRGVGFEPSLPNAEDLLAIARQAKSLADAIPRTGADPKQARLHLIGSLADIYEMATGRVAARRVNRVGGSEEGPFFRFCWKVAAYIDERAVSDTPEFSAATTTGIESDVRKVIEQRSKAS